MRFYGLKFEIWALKYFWKMKCGPSSFYLWNFIVNFQSLPFFSFQAILFSLPFSFSCFFFSSFACTKNFDRGDVRLALEVLLADVGVDAVPTIDISLLVAAQHLIMDYQWNAKQYLSMEVELWLTSVIVGNTVNISLSVERITTRVGNVSLTEC